MSDLERMRKLAGLEVLKESIDQIGEKEAKKLILKLEKEAQKHNSSSQKYRDLENQESIMSVLKAGYSEYLFKIDYKSGKTPNFKDAEVFIKKRVEEWIKLLKVHYDYTIHLQIINIIPLIKKVVK